MSLSSSRALAAAVLTGAALLVAPVPALAASPFPTTTTTSTTSSSSSSSTTSSTTTSSTLVPSSSTTTTTTRPTTSTSTTSTTTAERDEIPPEVQAMIDAYPRTPAGSTTDLVDALASLTDVDRVGGFGRFPVAGRARWSNDWLFPRHEPSFHVHEGTDVFAPRGTAVLSPAAGVAHVSEGSVGGLAVRVVQSDGTWWYLAHLDEATVTDGTRVTPGSVVGVVGDTGNAKGGSPHVHVEVHPLGGDPIDPKGLLDAHYDEALAGAPAYVMRTEAARRAELLRAGLN